jgi:hypothetical protein
MIKKMLFVIITVSLFLTGCSNSAQTSESPVLEPKESTVAAEANTESNVNPLIDYKQYPKKTWIRNTDTDLSNNGGLTFLISKIEDGKIQGKIWAVGHSPAYNMDSAEFEGTVNKDTAECQLIHDTRGNKGTIKFLFKPNDTIEATIQITEKSGDTVMSLPSGTFEFAPDNLKNIEGFAPIENQSFMVDLNSWGNVKFVSGKLTAGNHIPVEFYLTNKDGDILYNFNAVLPYNVDVKAVSFEDVNKDGLKDIIIIVEGKDGKGQGNDAVATVYFQKAEGSYDENERDNAFENNPKLDQEINNSGNNKDIKTVKSYLAQKL